MGELVEGVPFFVEQGVAGVGVAGETAPVQVCTQRGLAAGRDRDGIVLGVQPAAVGGDVGQRPGGHLGDRVAHAGGVDQVQYRGGGCGGGRAAVDGGRDVGGEWAAEGAPGQDGPARFVVQQQPGAEERGLGGAQLHEGVGRVGGRVEDAGELGADHRGQLRQFLDEALLVRAAIDEQRPLVQPPIQRLVRLFPNHVDDRGVRAGQVLLAGVAEGQEAGVRQVRGRQVHPTAGAFYPVAFDDGEVEQLPGPFADHVERDVGQGRRDPLG